MIVKLHQVREFAQVSWNISVNIIIFFFSSKQRVLKGDMKHGHLNIYSSMTSGQTPSVDEDHMTRLKAPEQLLKGPCDWKLFSIKGQSWPTDQHMTLNPVPEWSIYESPFIYPIEKQDCTAMHSSSWSHAIENNWVLAF